MKKPIVTFKNDKAIYSKVCSITKKTFTVEIPISAYDELHSHKRRTIQEILSDYTPQQREFLISGCTPSEWDDLMKEY